MRGETCSVTEHSGELVRKMLCHLIRSNQEIRQTSIDNFELAYFEVVYSEVLFPVTVEWVYGPLREPG